MMVHLCCFWPVKTIGCQQQETTCDVAGCDAMKREYRYIKYISFWNWLCIWSYTNCRLFEILAATESKHESIRISRNEIELFCFLGGYPFSAGPIFHAMAGCVISLPSTWPGRSFVARKFDGALLGLHFIGCAICPIDGSRFPGGMQCHQIRW